MDLIAPLNMAEENLRCIFVSRSTPGEKSHNVCDKDLESSNVHIAEWYGA